MDWSKLKLRVLISVKMLERIRSTSKLLRSDFYIYIPCFLKVLHLIVSPKSPCSILMPLTVCYHVKYAFYSEPTLCSCQNVKELLS